MTNWNLSEQQEVILTKALDLIETAKFRFLDADQYEEIDQGLGALCDLLVAAGRDVGANKRDRARGRLESTLTESEVTK